MQHGRFSHNAETRTRLPQRVRRDLFPCMSVKEQVLQAIQRLPEDIDYRDAADEIAFLSAVREAEQDIANGRLVSNEQMKARIAEWTAK
jgi:hypothetical protein